MDQGNSVVLYQDGPAQGAHAPILVTQFDGAMDAGAAGNLAVAEMLRSLAVQRVATFDSDTFIDYRSHRPVMSVKDWVTTGMETPEIALDLVHDDMGHPLLLLHGPEPDARWEAFSEAVAGIAHDAGVEVTVSLHGIPSGVPHTRPTPVHVQATDPSLVPDQPQMAGTMQFPAPLSSFLQERLSTTGIEGVAMLAAVPYYMSDNAYPGAASALISRLAEFGDLSLPVGDLERGAAEDIEQVSELVSGNAEVTHTIEALERHYDAMAGGADAGPMPTLPQGVWDESKSEDIGDVIEAYLANRARHGREFDGDGDGDQDGGGDEGGDGGDAPESGDRTDADTPAETVQDVLDRLGGRGTDGGPVPGGDVPRARPQARHRAGNPWDDADRSDPD